MAELYVARATGVHGFQKYVAIKRIHPQWAEDRELMEMFLDEARLAAQLDHPNVVHVHDIGQDDDGPFFAMEYIHGQSVLALLRRLRARDVLLPWDALVALGSAAAAGLHHAHERRGFDGKPLGIIHRDVSPSNILVTHEGVVKVIDFGIAKAASNRHATRTNGLKGKMAYMSPEQCKGEALDRRGDVFSLGVVLYELVTLARAFQGEGDFAVVTQIVHDDLPPPSSRRPEVPAEIDRILLRALARDPAARYDSARALQHALDEFAVDMGLRATPEALVAVMDEHFGPTPYPWEGTHHEPTAEATEATEATGSPPTVAKAMAATRRETDAPRSTEAERRRVALRRVRRWSALALGGLASIAWVVAARDRDAQATPTRAPAPAIEDAIEDAPAASPGLAPSPAIETAPAPRPTPSPPPEPGAPEVAPSRSPEPVDPPPPATIAAAPAAPAPAPTDAAPRTDEPARRAGRTATRKGAATKPADARAPALPAPFDPDAPAPRVR